MSDYITLSMSYLYKGTHNGTVRLMQEQNEDGIVHVVNEYGETMARVTYGHELARVLDDLRFNEYE